MSFVLFAFLLDEKEGGDASADDPLNADDIGENELLVVSFGTSFNDSRATDIGGIEKALQEANPDWSVRRAFTSQIIINHVQARDGEVIDNIEQALERAKEIERYCAARIGGLALPRFVADVPGAERKIPIDLL